MIPSKLVHHLVIASIYCEEVVDPTSHISILGDFHGWKDLVGKVCPYVDKPELRAKVVEHDQGAPFGEAGKAPGDMMEVVEVEFQLETLVGMKRPNMSNNSIPFNSILSIRQNAKRVKRLGILFWLPLTQIW